MCKDDRMLIDKSDEIDGPENIKPGFDPIKLKQLNARMSTPNPHYGPNPGIYQHFKGKLNKNLIYFSLFKLQNL
jgi:hypothetical protein